MPSFFSVLDSNSFIRYGKYCRVLPQVSCSARVSPLFQLFCCVLGTSGVALVSVWGCCTFWVLRSGTIFGVFVAIREFYSGLATPPQTYPKQRFPGNLEIGSMHTPQGARRCRGREHDGHGPLLRPSRPSPWCSRVDERDDAPPAPPGSASAPGGLDVHLKPPPQGSLSGAVWRVDRGC